MKNNQIYFFLILLLIFNKTYFSQTIIFSEDFENVTLNETHGSWLVGNIPASFKEYNEDGHVFNNSSNTSLAMGNYGCRIFNSSTLSDASAFFTASHSYPNDYSKDWLVTPLISLNGVNNNAELRFEVVLSQQGNLEILVSNNGNLLTSNWQQVANYPSVSNGYYHVDLNSYRGQNINIAFKYTTTNLIGTSNKSLAVGFFDVISFGTASIDDYKSLNNDFDIYPNPAQNYIFISGEVNKSLFVKVFDINGRELLVAKMTNNIFGIDVSMLSPGIYFVEVNEVRKKILISN